MTPPVPPEAVRLALASRSRDLMDRPDQMVLSDERLTERMLEAAWPAIAAGVTAEDAPDWERRLAALRDELPPCPGCGCRTTADADSSECGCDEGCNDGPHAPGINVLIAQAVAAERERIRKLADEAGACCPVYAAPGLITARKPFADLIGKDIPND